MFHIIAIVVVLLAPAEPNKTFQLINAEPFATVEACELAKPEKEVVLRSRLGTDLEYVIKLECVEAEKAGVGI